jgi:hypothetical protein
LSTTTVWETGLTCDAAACGREFQLGEEILNWYGRKMHQACASADAATRREAAGEAEDVLVVARRLIEAGGRVILTRRQLRELVTIACAIQGFEPVRKPDAGTGRRQWYGRMHGWDAARVAAGLSAAEVAGLWQDFLDVGRIPPLRQADLMALMTAIEPTVIPA